MEHTTRQSGSKEGAGGSTRELADSTIAVVRKLIQLNLDSARGYREAAATVRSKQHKRLFQRISKDRKEFVMQLKRMCVENCCETRYDDMPPSRSIGATLHQWWMSLKANMSAEELYRVLHSAVEGEGTMINAYKEALQTYQYEDAIKSTLEKQFGIVEDQYNFLRGLLNQHRVH